MKRFLIVFAALSLTAAPAFAQVTNNGGSRSGFSPGDTVQAGASSSSTSVSGASSSSTVQNTFTPTNVNTNVNEVSNSNRQHQNQSQGQEQSQRQSQRQNNNQQISPSQTTTIEAAPSAPAIFAPNLTSSPEACMGSYSGGAGAGAATFSFGVTLGMTWTNQECQDRMTARTLAVLGQPQAALEYLAAGNPRVASALKQAGVKVSVNEVAPAPIAALAPAATSEGGKVERHDAPTVSSLLTVAPTCGDGKPAKLRPAGYYSCWGWDR